MLKSYETYALQAAKYLDVEVSKSWQPKYIWWMRTLLRSVHVHKKQRVQYETRTHFRCWQLRHVTGSTADTYLEYIQRNLPEGIGMKVTKEEILPVPEHIRPPKTLNLGIKSAES